MWGQSFEFFGNISTPEMKQILNTLQHLVVIWIEISYFSSLYSKQLVANKLAKLAVVACARLAGLIDQPPELASPKNPVIEESLAGMKF